MNLVNKRVLIVVAHPDDEILGIGGTIFKLVNDYNCKIKVIILGEGITSRSDSRDVEKHKDELFQHKIDIEKAKKILTYQELVTFDFPDNRFDTVPLLDIIKKIEKEKSDFNPDIVFTHHNGDLNIDHRKTFQAVYTSCRPLKDETVNTIATFETLSGTEWIASNDPRRFIPNFFITLNDFQVKIKVKAMESYTYEIMDYPHPRSSKVIRNRAEMWGNTVGEPFAEAFQIIRTIV